MQDKFKDTIQEGYDFEGASINLGTGMLEGEAVEGAIVRAPIRMFNRHGLISGATGTGKTISLQILAEQLSKAGTSVLLMDFKGDLSGLGKEGSNNKHIEKRHALLGEPWESCRFPVEFLTLTGQDGVRLRATVSEFGPVLFSKILGLNETQGSITAMVFKFCDDENLPLLDLKDFRKVLQFITGPGKASFQAQYGLVSGSSVSAIIRRVLELEQQGADLFFGERSFDVQDLVRKDAEGRGMISILRLDEIQDKPKLFSTFMLCLLAEIYQKFPESGDLEVPKLVVFIDEAHLVFKNASDDLMEQLESIIKLIRSKSVGIFFCTQNPTDIPPAILSQLGLKIQHALRAFTARDRKAIKLVAENYPLTDYYEVKDVITQLGIGEALVTVLNEDGIPTPLAHALLRSPSSRMGILEESEIKAINEQSRLIPFYNESIDRDSAYELLMKKMETATVDTARDSGRKTSRKEEESIFEQVLNSTTTRQVSRTVARELTRGLLKVLGVK